MTAHPPAILLMGPTASGKTAVALHLAEVLPVELISVDSDLGFRDLDIGTAQPDCAFSRGGCIFSAMDDGPVSGIWTLRIYDIDLGPPTETNSLASWRLHVIAGKPYKTK